MMNDNTQTRERLHRARALIDACYDRPLDLEQIAREASFSRYYFIRLFRRAFEHTPHQYLMRRRIERAKELLAADTLSITEVCYAVGFQSPGSFSMLFHRAVGHSPTDYRVRAHERRRAQTHVPACFLKMFGVEPAV